MNHCQKAVETIRWHAVYLGQDADGIGLCMLLCSLYHSCLQPRYSPSDGPTLMSDSGLLWQVTSPVYSALCTAWSGSHISVSKSSDAQNQFQSELYYQVFIGSRCLSPEWVAEQVPPKSYCPTLDSSAPHLVTLKPVLDSVFTMHRNGMSDDTD